MTNIKESIESVLEKIKKFRPSYEQNEMWVRDQIVNPILRCLGWNPENPEEVQPNVSTEEGIPDYSLWKNGRRVLFVEAKKLSVDIEQKETISQLAKYCFGEGMKYGVLSNGAVWLFFRAFQEGTTMAERIVWKVDIENDDLTACIRRLNTISKDSIESVESLIKKLQILDEVWRAFLEEPKELIAGLIPVFQKHIKEGYPEYSFDSAEMEDFIKERVQALISPSSEGEVEIPLEHEVGERAERPREMRIGKDVFEIRSSYEILMNTANWLIKQNKLKVSDAPIASGYKRNLINKEPNHKYGESFRAPKKLSNGLWIETHKSTATCINDARHLLEKFGYQGDTLAIK